MTRYVVEKTDGSTIPPDEPCFVLRGRDTFTPQIVRSYYDLAEKNGAPNEFLREIDEILVSIHEYQWNNPGKVKFPD